MLYFIACKRSIGLLTVCEKDLKQLFILFINVKELDHDYIFLNHRSYWGCIINAVFNVKQTLDLTIKK